MSGSFGVRSFGLRSFGSALWQWGCYFAHSVLVSLVTLHQGSRAAHFLPVQGRPPRLCADQCLSSSFTVHKAGEEIHKRKTCGTHTEALRLGCLALPSLIWPPALSQLHAPGDASWALKGCCPFIGCHPGCLVWISAVTWPIWEKPRCHILNSSET